MRQEQQDKPNNLPTEEEARQKLDAIAQDDQKGQVNLAASKDQTQKKVSLIS